MLALIFDFDWLLAPPKNLISKVFEQGSGLGWVEDRGANQGPEMDWIKKEISNVFNLDKFLWELKNYIMDECTIGRVAEYIDDNYLKLPTYDTL